MARAFKEKQTCDDTPLKQWTGQKMTSSSEPHLLFLTDHLVWIAWYLSEVWLVFHDVPHQSLTRNEAVEDVKYLVLLGKGRQRVSLEVSLSLTTGTNSVVRWHPPWDRCLSSNSGSDCTAGNISRGRPPDELSEVHTKGTKITFQRDTSRIWWGLVKLPSSEFLQMHNIPAVVFCRPTGRKCHWRGRLAQTPHSDTNLFESTLGSALSIDCYIDQIFCD